MRACVHVRACVFFKFPLLKLMSIGTKILPNLQLGFVCAVGNCLRKTFMLHFDLILLRRNKHSYGDILLQSNIDYPNIDYPNIQLSGMPVERKFFFFSKHTYRACDGSHDPTHVLYMSRGACTSGSRTIPLPGVHVLKHHTCNICMACVVYECM